MSEVCRSTRYGPGCGHPVEDHDGGTGRECCCCSWRHNDPAHVTGCLDCAILHAKRRLPPGATYGDVAPLVPEHLHPAMWRRAVERFFERELAEGRIDPEEAE